ncbi:WYL domain-containing protein [Aromatoleum evansii]|uniref:WYL domain-containing protein n=1 Tax=Aromatoleum evansii TaxID=59406 RepID=A0ABZ1ALC2_AROEV|nr:WYL domain-containing protein [Aromatoleum evansii]
MTARTTSTAPAAPSASRPSGRWSQERRLEFIDYRLRWDGHLNRSDLIEFFGISVPQASLDIARYTELAPNNIRYDTRARTYLSGTSFAPLYNTDNPQRYLNDLLVSVSGLCSEGSLFIGWAPPVGVTPIPTRVVSTETLGRLLQAIRNRETVKVKYQSLTSEEPQDRTLSPHALAFDGFRWHVRAFCHARQSFRDFVIARMLAIRPGGASTVSPEDDRAWHTAVTLVIAPHSGLPPPQRKVIELDYGMEDGEARLQCRQALLFYLLKHLGFDGRQAVTPQAQQIILKNEAEVERHLNKATFPFLGQ